MKKLAAAIVTFPTVKAARNFIGYQGCTPLESSCKQPFVLEAYGSNYLLLDDIDTLAAKGLRLALSILGISLVAVLSPLVRNVRRNPINDMRDE